MKPKCHYCNDTGYIACRSRDGQYAFPGPVPDDAKGYFDADCWYCDSGPPPIPDVPDARDPDYSRPGIFAHHNCSRCKDGTDLSRCPTPDRPGNCGYPQARND